jgi:IS30 family transposase
MITHTVVERVDLLLVDQRQLLLGVNQHLDTKLERKTRLLINSLSREETRSSRGKEVMEMMKDLDLIVLSVSELK